MNLTLTYRIPCVFRHKSTTIEPKSLITRLSKSVATVLPEVDNELVADHGTRYVKTSIISALLCATDSMPIIVLIPPCQPLPELMALRILSTRVYFQVPPLTSSQGLLESTNQQKPRLSPEIGTEGNGEWTGMPWERVRLPRIQNG